MSAAAQSTELIVGRLVRRRTSYPVELPQETSHYNQLVVDKLLSVNVAVLCVDRDIVSFPERSSLPLVTYDNRRAGYLVTDHLIKRGCKRIVFIGSPYVSSAASDRMRGYCDALEDNGLHVDRSLIRRKPSVVTVIPPIGSRA